MGVARLSRSALRDGILPGVGASAAYLLEQELDRRVVSNRYDDLLLWGGFLSRTPARQRIYGLMVHCFLGIGLAGAFSLVDARISLLAKTSRPPSIAAVLRRYAAMPLWARGLLFAQAENALLYPGVPLLNGLHPEVRTGRLPSLLTWRYFWVEVARHAAYGAVLGAWAGRAGARTQRTKP